MKIKSIGGKFVIYRNEDKELYFSAYVDADKSSWSRYLFNAARFETEGAALKAIEQLRARKHRQRQQRAIK